MPSHRRRAERAAPPALLPALLPATASRAVSMPRLVPLWATQSSTANASSRPAGYGIFRRQPIVDGDHRAAAASRELHTLAVIGVEIAEYESP